MYYVYILRCSDDSLCVGYTTNVEASRKPTTWAWEPPTPTSASR